MDTPDLILDRIDDLPTLPDVVAEVNRLVNDSNASAGDLNSILSRDVALSAKILKLVNSSFYGFPRRITSISQAVVILGFNTIRNLSLSAFVFDSLKGRSSLFDTPALWAHSIGVAVAAQTVGQRIGISQVEDLFMAGILHDIGKVVMCQYMPEYTEKIMQTVAERNCTFLDAERQFCEWTHAELGGALLERWNLPVTIVACVMGHHGAAGEESMQRGSAIIHLADVVTRTLAIGKSGDNLVPIMIPSVPAKLELSAEDIGKVMDTTLDEIRQADAFFELAGGM